MLDSAEMWKQALSENHFTRHYVACELYSHDCEASTEILQHLASDPDAVVRLSAVSSIERRRFDGYIPMLVRMMHEDTDQLVRRSCMNSLIYIPAGAAFVVDALDDPDDRVVVMTILTLQQTGSMWASNAVAECLMHRNWWIRYLAACALLKFNRSSQILVDAIQGLRDVSEAQEMVRNSAFSDTMSIALAKYPAPTRPRQKYRYYSVGCCTERVIWCKSYGNGRG